MIVKNLKMEGFIVTRWAEKFFECFDVLRKWVEEVRKAILHQHFAFASLVM
jgi:NADPH-dependent curcumin reductase CurA